jgi:hypothetical protein
MQINLTKHGLGLNSTRKFLLKFLGRVKKDGNGPFSSDTQGLRGVESLLGVVKSNLLLGEESQRGLGNPFSMFGLKGGKFCGCWRI